MLLLLQSRLIPTPYLANNWLPALAMLVAALLTWALLALREQFGVSRVLQALAWGLVIGGLYNVLIATLQWFDAAKLLPWFALGANAKMQGVVGNLGQRNWLTEYLLYGMLAICWLLPQVSRNTQRLLWLAAVAFAWVIAMTGSRSPILIGAALVLWATWQYRQHRSAFSRHVMMMIGLLALATFGFWLQQQLWGAGESAITSINRGGMRRLIEWQKCIDLFLAHPWLGVGWGNYAWHSFQLQQLPAYAKVVESAMFDHSHNAFFQLLAVTGLAGLACIAPLLWVGVRQICRREQDNLIGALLIVILIRAQLEWSLWVPGFFFFAVILLALCPQSAWGRRAWKPSFRLSIGLFALCMLLVSSLTVYQYTRLSRIFTGDKNLKGDSVMIDLVSYSQNIWLSAITDRIIAARLSYDRNWLPMKLDLLTQVNLNTPHPVFLIREAYFLALNGQTALAHQRVQQVLVAYPRYRDQFIIALLEDPSPEGKMILSMLIDHARRYGPQLK
ncbi:Wzy polymerase domain-containing protein [Leeia sp.]|uniref:PglL family O-oligosaccharyltransferase n=1 Tax=Leeia sp. TaxID=2884678 RepID=UPI0035B0DEEC